MGEVKAAFKAALMSIPEGSTCYWLIKKKSSFGKMNKIDEIAASYETDIYEEIIIKHGSGEYLVWLFDNNDQKLIKMPIRFEIPEFEEDEHEEELQEEDPDEELKKLKIDMIKKAKNDLNMSELLSIKNQISPNQQTSSSNNEFISALEKIERRAEEREKRLEEKINSMQQQNQQNGMYSMIAEMQKSSSRTTELMMQQQSESQKMMMNIQGENQKTLMAILQNDNKKDIFDSPFFLELYKKATDKPKGLFDDSMGKMMDMFFSTQQQTMQRMVDMQFEAGQNDVFLHRMKMFKDMFVQMGPGIKDFAIKMASINAAKETEKEKIKAQKGKEPNKQQNFTQQPQPQQKQQKPAQKTNIITIKRNPQPQRQETVDKEKIKKFLFSIYNRIIENEDIQQIEKDIIAMPGAIQEIKNSAELLQFVDQEGGKIKVLFDKLRNMESGNERNNKE
ncbi:hypothetical protein [Candidatus Uabimicrobium sp. HlEnr_7]|uniref:hypothetical protein n=1 Tax=Candidatus Uabimicrobium helgolandensis TaxID=3095367 RepID=UPI003558FC1B